MKQLIKLIVNRESYEVAICPYRTLSEVLQKEIMLTGNKSDVWDRKILDAIETARKGIVL